MNSSKKHKTDLLMLVSRFPYPLEKGDKLRAYCQLRELSKSFNVTLVALTEEAVPPEDFDQVKKYCSQIHIGRLTPLSKLFNILRCFINGFPFQTGYFFSFRVKRMINRLIQANNFKHIYCQLIRTSEYVKNIHHIPKTIDYMDALSAGMRRRIEKQFIYNRWLYRSEARRLAHYERRIFDFFENHTIISEQDKHLIAHPEKKRIHVVPNGVDEVFFEKLHRDEQYDLVFVGNMNYPPNVDAVHYIVDNILTQIPEITLLVAGASPHPSIVKLGQNNNRVTVSGWVDDIRKAYCSGKLFLAPMMMGTGMQNKLLEAMAVGTPCITTSLSNNAIKAENGREIIVAEDAEAIINAVNYLLSSEEKRRSIAMAGRKMVEENYSWPKVTKLLIGIMDPQRIM